LKPGAAAESRATAGNHTARDGEPRAALGKGEQTRNTNERILEILKGRPTSKLSKTDRISLVRHLKNSWLNFRPKQAEFQCVVFGHAINADEQAALNIARKFLFEPAHPTKKVERDRRAKWELWYRGKLATVWKN